ncbi:MAG: hypothetical protein ABW170_19240 [Candidatus Thiodiazotropha sp. L084R]
MPYIAPYRSQLRPYNHAYAYRGLTAFATLSMAVSGCIRKLSPSGKQAIFESLIKVAIDDARSRSSLPPAEVDQSVRIRQRCSRAISILTNICSSKTVLALTSKRLARRQALTAAAD